ASAIIAGSAPAICTEIGSTSPSWLARRRVFSLPHRREFDATISDTARPAPNCLHNCRKGRSVTPAIGATKRLFRKVREPIRIDDRGVFCGSAILYLNASVKGRLSLARRVENSPGFTAARERRRSCDGRESAAPAARHRAAQARRRERAREAQPSSRTP